MKTKRCPWCGKKLSNGSNIWERIKIGIKPVHQCPFCFNPMSSPLSTILYAPILLVIIGFYLNTNTLLFIVFCLSAVVAFALCLLLIIFGKYNYYKMGPDGKKLDSNEKKYKGCIQVAEYSKLRKNQLLLTDKSFDKSESFSLPSPIRITKYSMKKHRIEFTFLYDQEQNQSLIESGAFIAYVPDDSNPIPINIQNVK